MSFDNAVKRYSMLSFGAPIGFPNYVPGNGLNEEDRLTGLWNYAGFDLPVQTFRTVRRDIRSRDDSFVMAHGDTFTLIASDALPNVETGKYEPSEVTNVKMRLHRTVNSNKGKFRLYMVTYMSMKQRKPIKNMRLTRNGIEMKIMDVQVQRKNSFLIRLDTLNGGEFPD